MSALELGCGLIFDGKEKSAGKPSPPAIIRRPSDMLPTEVIAHLLGWVPMEQCCILRLVNKKWCGGVSCLMELELTAQISYGLWKPSRRVAARRLLLVCCPMMSGQVLGSVTEVRLSECDRAGGEMTIVADHFVKFERLSCPRTVTDADLEGLAKVSPLRSLDLTWCRQVTDAGLTYVAKLTSLTAVNLNCCNQITDTGLVKGIVNLTALIFLDLGGRKQITDAVLCQVAKLDSLTSLNLHECEQVTDVGLREVAKLGALTSLSVGGCKQITDAGLCELAKLSALTSFTLFWCREITDVGLSEVAKHGALTSLNLCGCYQITDAGLCKVVKLRALKSLDVSYCVRITEAGLFELAKLGVLTSLDLFQCGRITDAGRQLLKYVDKE